MTRLFVTFGLLLCVLMGTAAAQGTGLSINSFNPDMATAPIDMVEGRGVKVGERTTLHPVIGMQTGLSSNVFFEESNPNAAGVLRLMAQVGAGSLTGLRLVPAETVGGDQRPTKGSFEYRAELRLAYDMLLSSNNTVRDTGGLGVGATLRGMVNPLGPWTFGFNENFTRIIRAANFETDANTNRNINTLSLNGLYHPQSRTLAVNAYYNNVLDIFERSEQNFANRWIHRVGLKPMWRWLPETVVFADVSWGVTTGISSSTEKVTSYPLAAIAGVATLLTPKITLNAQAGYVNGFYTEGPSYSGATIGTQLGYRYTPLGRVTAGYSLVYNDSVNANFFRDHVVMMNVEHLLAPFVVMLQPAVHFRRYEGTFVMGTDGGFTRNDVIFSVIGGIHYNFRNSLAATLDYNFASVQSDFSYMVDGIVDDPGFVRHQLLAGVRWAL